LRRELRCLPIRAILIVCHQNDETERVIAVETSNLNARLSQLNGYYSDDAIDFYVRFPSIVSDEESLEQYMKRATSLLRLDEINIEDWTEDVSNQARGFMKLVYRWYGYTSGETSTYV